FKTEFGKVNGRLVVADELTPNASRIWDIETREKLDGELSFEHSDKLAAAYTEVLRRLQEAISR
ncbi:MAG: phosphoribosylaminoimidazolesuccinocarboxamide synthase, partial [Clostridia bacterium]